MSCDVGEVTEGLENELLQLRHSSFSNPFFASPTSQALHLIHVASRPCRILTRIESISVLTLSCVVFKLCVRLLHKDYLVFLVNEAPQC